MNIERWEFVHPHRGSVEGLTNVKMSSITYGQGSRLGKEPQKGHIGGNGILLPSAELESGFEGAWTLVYRPHLGSMYLYFWSCHPYWEYSLNKGLIILACWEWVQRVPLCIRREWGWYTGMPCGLTVHVNSTTALKTGGLVSWPITPCNYYVCWLHAVL